MSFVRLLLAISISAIPSFAQGFGAGAAVAIGKRGESVQLTRTLPPVVDLTGLRVSVEAEGPGGTPRDVIDLLTIRARAELEKATQYRIQVVNSNAQRVVRCVIPVFEVTDQRREQQTGAAAEQFVVVKGSMAAIIDVIDPVTDRSSGSENLKTAYEKWFRINLTEPGQSPGVNIAIRKRNKTVSNDRVPTQQEKYAVITEGIVEKFARAFVPPTETILVPLPRKKLRPLSLMASKGKWPELREAAEKAASLPKPADDAYRFYLIGLANEAQAYTPKADAVKLLTEAIAQYTKARDAKPLEKGFHLAIARAEESLERFKRKAR